MRMVKEFKVRCRKLKVKTGAGSVRGLSTRALYFLFSGEPLLHSVFLPLLEQRFTANAQNLRGFGDVVAGRFKRLRDGFALERLQRAQVGQKSRAARRQANIVRK